MLNRSAKVDVSIRRTANGLRNCMESASGVKAQQRQVIIVFDACLFQTVAVIDLFQLVGD